MWIGESMLRISKLTDYGIVLLAHFARSPAGAVLSAREVSEATAVALPTVAKLVRHLTRAGVLTSTRGKAGGYSLAVDPERLDVATIIGVFEGPIGLTQCSLGDSETCESEVHCPLREHWPHISFAVRTALEAVTLADLTKPLARDGWNALKRAAQPTPSPDVGT